MPEDNPVRKSFETGRKSARDALDRGLAGAEQAARQAEQGYSSAAEGISEFNAKLIDFARVNTTAGLEFVAELARAKGPTEALDLWSRYVQNHFQRLSDQSQELAKLGERMASSNAEPLTRSLHQTL